MGWACALITTISQTDFNDRAHGKGMQARGDREKGAGC